MAGILRTPPRRWVQNARTQSRGRRPHADPARSATAGAESRRHRWRTASPITAGACIQNLSQKSYVASTCSTVIEVRMPYALPTQNENTLQNSCSMLQAAPIAVFCSALTEAMILSPPAGLAFFIAFSVTRPRTSDKWVSLFFSEPAGFRYCHGALVFAHCAWQSLRTKYGYTSQR